MTLALPPGHSHVRVFGRTDARDYDYACDPVELGPQRATFRTRSTPSHLIEVTPRYVGGSLEVPTRGADYTMCGLSFDGNYAALAMYYRLPNGILIVPDDYSPTWVYEISKEERVQRDARLAAIRKGLGG